jgi:hypothetical protein
MDEQPLAEAAASYARRGWRVLPCVPREKYPLCPRGLHDATADPDVVRWWWRRWPDANIGVRTGTTVDVIDVDSPEGIENLRDAAGIHRLGWGPISSTGRGWHYWIAGDTRRSRIGFVHGVDLKACGGYVIAPPSIHPSGRQYRWLEGHGPDDVAPGQPPAWLAELLDPPPVPRSIWRPPEGRPTARVLRYAWAALGGEADAVAGAGVGTRNNVLNTAAFRMRRFVDAGHLDESDVTARLLEAAASAGLDELEARRTISSGLGVGR